MKKREKPLAIIVSAVLIAGLLYNIPSIKAVDNIDYGISNPVIDDRMPQMIETIWDCIYFGNYWQNDTNNDGVADQNDEKQPIKWRVLSVSGNDAFLLADQNLDAQPYNQEREGVTWETCTLQSWLNDNFYNTAFVDVEKSSIKTAEGKDHKIYLLSDEDIYNTQYGFNKISYSRTRVSLNTLYAITCGAFSEDIYEGYWWINSQSQAHTEFMKWVKHGEMDIQYVNTSIGAVRPCLHIDLSLSTWTKAGSISSSGYITDKSIAELATTTEATTTTQAHVIQVPQANSSTQNIVSPVTPSTTQVPKDKIKPSVKGVKNKKVYKKAVTIKFSDKQSGIKKATLNGKKIKSGKKVKKNGKYTLKVYDKAGNCTTVKFTIKIKKKK